MLCWLFHKKIICRSQLNHSLKKSISLKKRSISLKKNKTTFITFKIKYL